MPRFPKPFFRQSRGLWYVQVGGKQINLGHDRDAAFRQYHALMGTGPRTSATNAARGHATLVVEIIERVPRALPNPQFASHVSVVSGSAAGIRSNNPARSHGQRAAALSRPEVG